jgi:hypothetical protein
VEDAIIVPSREEEEGTRKKTRLIGNFINPSPHRILFV